MTSSPAPGRPAISMVLATDSDEAVAEVLASLRSQSAAERLEVVIVAPRESPLTIAPGADWPFASLQVVTVDSIVPLREARAVGVRAATAEAVVVGETHAFPLEGWAEALIEALRGPWAAVVPLIEDADPDRAISWSNFLLTYGPWMNPPAREVDRTPEQNAVYRRDLLLEYGSLLPQKLDSGGGLDADLRARGLRLYLEPAARVRHVEVSSAGAWLPERFSSGRAFAALRAQRWSRARRLAYSVAFPGIVVAFLVQSVRRTGGPGWWRGVPRLTIPAVVMGIVAWSAGEAVGYLAGGGAEARACDFEVNRRFYVARPRAVRPAATSHDR
jgi:hypothetical protein